MVTAAQLKKFCPSAKAELVNAIVNNWSAAESVEITTPLRIQHFLTQIAVETGGLRSVEESLMYTSVARIRAVWPSRFKTDAQAKPFVRKPKELAIKVYGGRMGNAASPATDGWLYRGGGMLQTTGREGYRKLGFELNPEALRDPQTAFSSALSEWRKRGCNAMADRDDLVAIRKAINGGTNGLDEALKYLTKAKSIFTQSAPVAKPVPVLTPVPPIDSPVEADPKLVETVQRLLREKGYPEVGEADNKMGKRTRNAILAFEADNGMPLTGAVGDELLAALVKAPMRENSAAREQATAQDLKEKGVPTVKVADQLQKVGKGVLGTMGVGLLGQGAMDFEDVQNRLNTAKGIYDTIVSFSPWLIGAAVAGVTVYFGSRIIRAQVEAYRKGHSV